MRADCWISGGRCPAADEVMEQVANQVKAVLEEESGVQTEVMLFSSNYGLMARTAGADAYVRELLEMERHGSNDR